MHAMRNTGESTSELYGTLKFIKYMAHSKLHTSEESCSTNSYANKCIRQRYLLPPSMSLPWLQQILTLWFPHVKPSSQENKLLLAQE